MRFRQLGLFLSSFGMAAVLLVPALASRADAEPQRGRRVPSKPPSVQEQCKNKSTSSVQYKWIGNRCVKCPSATQNDGPVNKTECHACSEHNVWKSNSCMTCPAGYVGAWSGREGYDLRTYQGGEVCVSGPQLEKCCDHYQTGAGSLPCSSTTFTLGTPTQQGGSPSNGGCMCRPPARGYICENYPALTCVNGDRPNWCPPPGG